MTDRNTSSGSEDDMAELDALRHQLEEKEAELLQVKPSTLNEMMKRLGIHSKSNMLDEEVVTAD